MPKNILILLCMFLFSIIFLSCSAKTQAKEIKMQDPDIKYNELTKEEEYILLKKGTERPFTGALLDNKEDGTYICKRCDNELFASDTKFDSGTGWPSFDEALEGGIEYKKDGFRTEVVCARCGGHLGHVFHNEGFTAKNARYCINSLALNFTSEE